LAAIAHYHAEAARLRSLAFEASELHVAAYKANLLEWKAITGREAGAGEIEFASLRDIARRLTRLRGSIGDEADLKSVLADGDRYRLATQQEFNLLAQGRSEEATRYDENVVDPAFDRFIANLSDLHRNLADRASVAYSSEGWGSAVIAAVTIFLVVILARGHQKRVIRENRSHALRLAAESAERRQRAILERSTTQVLITDEHGLIVGEAVPVKPFTLETVPKSGTNIQEAFAPASRQEIAVATARIVQGGSAQQLMLTIGEGADSLYFDCSVTDYRSEPLIGGLLWTLTDVTEEHRSAAALEEVHRRLNNILFLSHAVVWSASADGSRLDYITDGCVQIFGRTAQEFLTTPNLWTQVVHPEDLRTIFSERLAELRRNGQATFEYRILRPDGSIRWVTNSIRLTLGEDGLVAGQEGAILDITEEKLARIALSESEKSYRRTLDRVSCIIYRLVREEDGTLRFSYVSAQSQDILGLDALEVMRDSSLFYRNVHPDDLPGLHRIRAESARTHEEFIWEGRVLVRGEYRWIRIWAVPGVDDNGLVVWDGITVDVTDAKRAQEIEIEKASVEQANAAKSDFLSRMSHELRTPLNAILGFGQLLQMQSEDENQVVMLGHIVEGGRHLLSLVNEILDISRIDSRRIAFDLQPVDIRRLVREVHDLLTPAAMSQRVSVHIENGEHDGAFALADPQRLRQILVNLVTNAVKYNHEGGSVWIRTVNADGRIRIEVQDNGPGIAPDKRHRLFTAFDRLGAEQTKVEGTGLGLALSQKLAEAMGGSISFAEAPGGGSRFTVDLPVTSDRPSPLPELELPREMDGTGQRTVLYIEDNPSNVELMRSVVGRINVDLAVTVTGMEGIEKANVLRPDLVLLDLDLPDMSGMEVLLALKRRPETSDIPVVIVSADANLSRIDVATESGAAGYVTKPFDVPRVLSILQHGPEGDYV
ncbi:MAG TPA: ATP-binding protein, partial [Fimbriimonadaceae bacterium]|nr:ATP-binding protein [Fimbriimonadaceae bacterium]